METHPHHFSAPDTMHEFFGETSCYAFYLPSVCERFATGVFTRPEALLGKHNLSHLKWIHVIIHVLQPFWPGDRRTTIVESSLLKFYAAIPEVSKCTSDHSSSDTFKKLFIGLSSKNVRFFKLLFVARSWVSFHFLDRSSDKTTQTIWICALGWSRKPKCVAQTTRRCCKSKRTDLAVCLLHDPTFFAKYCQTTDTPQGFFFYLVHCFTAHGKKKKQSLRWHRSSGGLCSEDWGHTMVASCQSQGLPCFIVYFTLHGAII